MRSIRSRRSLVVPLGSGRRHRRALAQPRRRHAPGDANRSHRAAGRSRRGAQRAARRTRHAGQDAPGLHRHRGGLEHERGQAHHGSEPDRRPAPPGASCRCRQGSHQWTAIGHHCEPGTKPATWLCRHDFEGVTASAEIFRSCNCGICIRQWLSDGAICHRCTLSGRGICCSARSTSETKCRRAIPAQSFRRPDSSFGATQRHSPYPWHAHLADCPTPGLPLTRRRRWTMC